LKRFLAILITLALAALMTSCASVQTQREIQHSLITGNLEHAYEQLEQAVRQHPHNKQYRAQLFRVREMLVSQWLVEADRARAARQLDLAESYYQRVLKIAPQNSRASAGLQVLAAERRHLPQIAEAEKALLAGDIESAEATARAVLAENPAHPEARNLIKRLEDKRPSNGLPYAELKATYRKPVTLEFRDASLKSIFEVISRVTGINFIFDKDVRPDLKATIFVKNTSVEDAIKLLLVTNQLERKVLNDTTVLIYPNTPAKNREYQDLVVKSFYLGNADVKQTLNMIKTLLKTRDVFIDEKLNMLVMRDTAEAVRVAEKLIASQDLAEPEVVLEVEVLEVSRNRLLELGIDWPNQVSYGQLGTAAGATAPELIRATRDNLQAFVVNPAIVVNLRQQDGSTNLLANPRIRVKNREKAKVHIGSRVPVITSTATATGFVAESVAYLDVGLKLDVEPNVYLDNEVAIKVALEVSNIAREIRTQSGTLTFEVGTRNASTTLRLRDGETQVLAGLIQDDERRSADKVPGLGDIPVVGRLFGSHNDTAIKTEIVLLVTPHVVRNLARPETVYAEFPFGTEAAAGAPPLILRPAAAATIPPSGTGAPTTPATTAPTTPGAPAAPGGAPPARSTPTSPPVVDQPLRLNWLAPGQAQIGKTFTVALNASAQDMKSASFEVAYDAAKLELVGIEEGGFLQQDGATGTLAFSASPDKGRAQVSINRPAPVSGEGTLATLAFRAVGDKPGPAQISVQGLQGQHASGSALPVAAPPAHLVNIGR
jgi:general secretion pathway protein D